MADFLNTEVNADICYLNKEIDPVPFFKQEYQNKEINQLSFLKQKYQINQAS